MSNKELTVNKTIIYNILSVVLIQGLSFFTSPIFSRLLGTNNYGIFSTFNAWVGVFVIVFPLCVNSTIAMALNKYSEKERPAYQSSTLTLGIIFICVFSVAVTLNISVLSKYMKMSIPLIVCMLFSTLFSFILMFGNEKFTYGFQANRNFFVALLNSIITIVFSLILVFIMPKDINYWGRIIGGMASSFILSVYLLIVIYKEGQVVLKKKYISFCLPLAIPVVFHSLSNVVLNQSDRIMIQGMCSNSLVGIYSLAYNFAAIMTAVYMAMNNSWTPFYFRYLEKGDRNNLYRSSKNYSTLYALMAFGFLMVFKEVYSVFADSTYWDGIKIIPMIVVGLFFMYLYSFAINYEFYIKKTKFMAVITSSAAIINLVLNYVLITKYDIMGAAVATSISYAYEFIIHYIYVKCRSGKEYPFDILFYLRPLLILVIALLLYYLFVDHVILRWGIAIAIGIFIIISIYRRRSIF